MIETVYFFVDDEKRNASEYPEGTINELVKKRDAANGPHNKRKREYSDAGDNTGKDDEFISDR
ncbi:MAG: hypothetical protein ACXVP0_14800, partial [Bacteroidia bacterium]